MQDIGEELEGVHWQMQLEVESVTMKIIRQVK
jgi:hypothetical protein